MFPDFFMHIGQALDLVSRYDSLRNPLTSLGDYLDPELISRCLAESGTVTLRKRRLPLEMMVWCIVGMALERKEPLHQIVNRLDIMLPGNRPFVAPSAVIQARQRLGSEAVRRVFTKTAQLWHNATPHPHWCGLTLLASMVCSGAHRIHQRTMQPSPARHMPGTRRSPAGQNGLPDGTDQPSADGCSLRHDEEQRK
ncbi:putative transposase [Shigella boydii 4444-74]|uniref:Putative transposase n=1 Tax=Shigella boydii 4444-74 TaxID=766140 RepID=I6E6H9_SHIBO|nr:putative transposase [Shigella boydii 4444-74]